jgi:putative ABC transport system substrate-binding protein
MALGPSLPEMYRRAAVCVHELLLGARAEERPVEQPTRFELILNLKAAETSGIQIPDGLLARAVETIS